MLPWIGYPRPTGRAPPRAVPRVTDMTPSPTGFAVVSTAPGARGPDLVPAVRSVVGDTLDDGSPSALQTAVWGDEVGPLVPGATVVLTREPRRRNHALAPADVARMVASPGHRGLAEVLPTFGAALHTGSAVTAATDALGLCHIYHRAGDGWAAISTSSRLLAALSPTRLDADGVAVQSLLGWQLGERCLFEAVTKLPAGRLVEVRDGRLRTEAFVAEPAQDRVGIADAVAATSSMLRAYLAAYLDEHPDAVLQLTGGQDSRLLLSAVEPRRRRGLRAMTLGPADSPDVTIAGSLARRYGMRHEVIGLDGLDRLDPEEAYERCLAAAGATELVADPLASAALGFVESKAAPGARISGLGGEIARGFYYLGRDGAHPVTEARVRRLADWRMLVNDAVEPAALRQDFRDRAREVAYASVHSALADTGRPWFEATDELYLGQRVQRWAGATESPACTVRRIVNPLLDDRWIATARALAVEDKAGSRFLGRLQIALDPELADVPLDGRPCPATYVTPGWRSAWRRGSCTVAKAGRKIGQRLRHSARAPVGGEILAASVLRHWRDDPTALQSVADADIVEPSWLEGVLAGDRVPRPSSVGFLLNLSVATATVRQSRASTV